MKGKGEAVNVMTDYNQMEIGNSTTIYFKIAAIDRNFRVFN